MLFKTLSAPEHKQHFFLPDIRASLKLISSAVTEKSTVHYTALLSTPVNSKETLLEVLSFLKNKQRVGVLVDKLVVAGDGMPYDLLLNLKMNYQADLEWVLPSWVHDTSYKMYKHLC